MVGCATLPQSMKKLLLLFFLIVPLVGASEVDDKINQIAELEKKVNILHTQAKTLANQIAYYNDQITLTGLKITQTETQINTLANEIDNLETQLQKQAVLLEKQIVQTYKHARIDPLQMFFSEKHFSEVLNKLKYLKTVQNQSRKFLHDNQVTQTTYTQQKEIIKQFKVKLEDQKVNLAGLKIEKNNLLLQTKNSESVYQDQLKKARLELEAIKIALATATKEGPIKAGDAIAVMGNSGYPDCSTGEHLHFEVQKNNTWANAETYVKNINAKGLSIGSGSWDWPLRGTITVTQRYGKTDYSYRYSYSGGIHTGIDMVSTEKIIYAPADGTLYSSSQKCGGSTIKIKYIDHGNDLKTFYLHVQ